MTNDTKMSSDAGKAAALYSLEYRKAKAEIKSLESQLQQAQERIEELKNMAELRNFNWGAFHPQEKPEMPELAKVSVDTELVFLASAMACQVKQKKLKEVETRLQEAQDHIEALQAAINQIIATVEYETDNRFHLEYCPHGAEWGKCSRCPLPSPPGDSDE